MLIQRHQTGDKILELHHLGNLKLNMQIRNPEPKDWIENPWEQPMIGTCYLDGYLYREVEHDFYYTYEKTVNKRKIETISFTKPISLLGRDAGRRALLMGLIPHQHPAVTRYDYDLEPAGFQIPTGMENFYGWEFFKTSLKKGVQRRVCNRRYGFLIPRDLEGDVKLFLPTGLFKHFYKCAPLYVLDVLDMIDFDFFDSVPPEYHEHFIPRMSQKLLGSGEQK